MLRKTMFVFWFLAMLGLAGGSGAAIAKNKTPTFEQVFTANPGDFPGGDPVLWGGLKQFQSSFYITISSWSVGGQIWRSRDGKTWDSVVSNDFGIDPDHHVSWDMTVFQGKLYIPVNCYGLAGCNGVMLRSSNGLGWEQIPLDTGAYQLDKLGVFKGMLYATSVWNGGQIWRSPNGNVGTWQVVKDLEPGIQSSSSPTEYKGHLYISGSDYGDYVSIWQSADGLHWNTSSLKITNSPVDPSVNFVSDGRLTVFKGDLYLCVLNDQDGGMIYRTNDGMNWEPVVTRDPNVWYYLDMIEYQGDLYAASAYVNPDDGSWGTKLWRSHTGNPGTWELVNADDSWGCMSIPSAAR